MDSREYAEKLRKLADWLDNRPQFDAGILKLYAFAEFYEKEPFVAAVKAVGSGKKEFIGESIYFYPAINADERIHVRLEAPRNKVCRLVSEAVYDCEPLLAPGEEASLGATEPIDNDIPF